MNCKDCRHWRKIEEPSWADEETRAGGICASEKLKEEDWGGHPPDSLVYSYHEGGDFWTGPMFGCVHFARLEP